MPRKPLPAQPVLPPAVAVDPQPGAPALDTSVSPPTPEAPVVAPIFVMPPTLDLPAAVQHLSACMARMEARMDKMAEILRQNYGVVV